MAHLLHLESTWDTGSTIIVEDKDERGESSRNCKQAVVDPDRKSIGVC